MAISAGLQLGLSALGALGNAGLGLWTNNQNVAAQERINAQNIAATRENNALARQWALDDWNRTNAYNSPVQQMQRLREAQLNPHLVYGNGAQNTATMVSRTEPRTPSINAPQRSMLDVSGVGDIVSRFLGTRNAEADIQNKQKQGEFLDQQIAGKAIDNAVKSFDFGRNKSLNDATIDTAIAKMQAAQADARKKSTEADLVLPMFEMKQRDQALRTARTSADIARVNASTLKTMFESQNMLPQQLIKLKKEIDLMLKNGTLRDLDIKLRNEGYSPSDPWYVRKMADLIKRANQGSRTLDSTVTY